jgi:hypothetical protein
MPVAHHPDPPNDRHQPFAQLSPADQVRMLYSISHWSKQELNRLATTPNWEPAKGAHLEDLLKASRNVAVILESRIWGGKQETEG